MIQSAGIAVVDWTESGPEVLCVRAYSNWDFPKGKVDPGETLEQAAARELEEETSLRVLDDVILASGFVAPSITYGKGSKAKTATYFIGDRSSTRQPYLPISPELGRPENDEWRWVPVSKLPELMPPRLQPVVAFLIDWVESNYE